MNYKHIHKNFTDTLCARFLMDKITWYNTYMTVIFFEGAEKYGNLN